jgi:hypothetical protein
LEQKHPLAAHRLAAGLSRIVASQKAVPVQRFTSLAARASLLFERKSASLMR